MTPSSRKNTPPLILASGSPRRKKLIKHLGIPFTVQPSAVNEAFDDHVPPSQVVQTLARRKARDVAAQYASAIVLGADTIVVHQENILGKPRDPDHARTMLYKLSDTTHQVLTGLALIKTNANYKIINEETFFESTDVTFGNLEPKEIEQYVSGGSPLDKAGSYGIQDDWGAIFVKRIKGDYYNIVGLPLHRLYYQLKNFAPKLFD